MINQASIDAVNASTSKGEVKPLYGSYCYSRIPQTIKSILEGNESTDALPSDVVGAKTGKAKKVVLFMIDALGWSQLESQFGKHPLLKRFEKDGIISQLTSQFPSTTAVHVSTIHSGQSIAQHAIPEFHYREPIINELMNPFCYSRGTDKVHESLKEVLDNPQKIFPDKTFYQELAESGVVSHIFSTPKEETGTYTEEMTRGAEFHSNDDIASRLDSLKDALSTADTPSYFYFYHGKIDKLSHRFGPKAEETQTEIADVLNSIEEFMSQPDLDLTDTTVLLTADHGQVCVDTTKAIRLDKIMPELEDDMMCSDSGDLLTPAGSPRDMFLYVKEDRVDFVAPKLQEKLGTSAKVHKTAELVVQGYFDERPSAKLLGRLPSLIIIPDAQNSIWWGEHKGRLGHHGGLHPDEMRIPFFYLHIKAV